MRNADVRRIRRRRAEIERENAEIIFGAVVLLFITIFGHYRRYIVSVNCRYLALCFVVGVFYNVSIGNDMVVDLFTFETTGVKRYKNFPFILLRLALGAFIFVPAASFSRTS